MNRLPERSPSNTTSMTHSVTNTPARTSRDRKAIKADGFPEMRWKFARIPVPNQTNGKYWNRSSIGVDWKSGCAAVRKPYPTTQPRKYLPNGNTIRFQEIRIAIPVVNAIRHGQPAERRRFCASNCSSVDSDGFVAHSSWSGQTPNAVRDISDKHHKGENADR